MKYIIVQKDYRGTTTLVNTKTKLTKDMKTKNIKNYIK